VTARVLIVDDAASYRSILSKTLAAIPSVEVVGQAGTVAAARRRLEMGGVDVVTLDVNLYQESGLELLHWIRRQRPQLITILVTAGEAAGAKTEVDALLSGAAAMILKPSGAGAAATLQRELARVITAALKPAPTRLQPRVASSLVLPAHRELIAIGASTGGPPVVQEFLTALPKYFQVPVVIIQHMPAAHMPFFLELLVAKSGRPGKVAADGELVQRGFFYLAGHGKHLVLRRVHGRLSLHHDDGPVEHFCKPAVDPFFRSVAAVLGPTAVGVVMSGMGHDGGAGAQALRAVGAPVVVQDEATSVVWSMPRSAVERGAVSQIAPRSELSKVVSSWISNQKDGMS